jgi:hypothetical protein
MCYHRSWHTDVGANESDCGENVQSNERNTFLLAGNPVFPFVSGGNFALQCEKQSLVAERDV